MPPSHDGCVRVRGAREHNLRDVDVDIPRDAMVVFTGRVGVGQVVAGVRHDLRRGAAAVLRVGGAVRAAAAAAGRRAGRRGDHRAAAGGGAAAAPRRRRRRARRSARSRRCPTSLRMLFSRAGRYPRGRDGGLDSDWFSPNTAVGRVPGVPRPRAGPPRHRGAARAGPVAEHPRARGRRVARRVAGAEPARHPRSRSATTSTGRGASCPKARPRLDPLHRRAAARSTSTRASTRSTRTTPTRARSRAPSGT